MSAEWPTLDRHVELLDTGGDDSLDVRRLGHPVDRTHPHDPRRAAGQKHADAAERHRESAKRDWYVEGVRERRHLLFWHGREKNERQVDLLRRDPPDLRAFSQRPPYPALLAADRLAIRSVEINGGEKPMRPAQHHV